MPVLAADINRFWAKVDVTGECWCWSAGTDPDGYGRFRVDGENHKAHRVSWAMHRGPIPAGKCALHRCDNRKCVRPSHLFLGTRRDNNADRVAKGRDAKGAQLPQAKLTAAKVVEIRRRIAGGDRQVDIARDMSVSKVAVCDVNKGRYWRHVD
jgi:hypothetical protein